MTAKEVVVNVETGVHARPAAMFVKLANRYPCEIFIEKDQTKVNGKSIMGLMMLALTKGSKIRVSAEGEKEEAAVNSLIDLVENDFTREDIL